MDNSTNTNPDGSSKKPVVVYHSQESLAKNDFDRPVVSSMLNNIFIVGNRIPIAILREMADDFDKLEKQITAQLPLNQATIKIEKPYWKKGQNVRDFDAVHLDIFGSLCTSMDRHCLDCIVAWGSLIEGAHNLTLRQLCENYIDLDVDWDKVEDQSVIDRKLLNRGVYFHCKVNDVLVKGMGVKATQKSRALVLERLRRLSIMTLFMSFLKDGKPIPNRASKVNLVDRDYFPLLDMRKIKNKNNVADDTYTDLIVNVSGFYLKSLETEGHISRKRFLNTYPELNGKHSVVDYWKFMDSHKREYFHERWLSEIVLQYLDDKVTLFGINVMLKVRQIMAEVLKQRTKLKEDYSFIAKPEDNPNRRIREQDYKLYYIPKLEGNP